VDAFDKALRLRAEPVALRWKGEALADIASRRRAEGRTGSILGEGRPAGREVTVLSARSVCAAGQIREAIADFSTALKLSGFDHFCCGAA